MRHYMVPMQLPTALPPKPRFDADMVLAETVAQTINRSAIVRGNDDGLTLMSSVNKSVTKISRQRGVERVGFFIGRDFKSEAAAVAQLAPFPRAELNIAHTNSVGVVENFNVSIVASDGKTPFGDGM